MAIRKRKNKWFVDLYPPNGKRYRKMVGTKKQAEEVERRIKSEIVEGKWELREKDITFSKFLTRYFEYTKDAKAKSTYKNDKYRIEAHLLPYFGKTSLKEITPEMIDKYISKRLKTEASNNTINHELVCLSHIIKTAIRWRYVDQNPVSFVEKLKVSKKNPRFLNIDEIKRLLESAQNTYIYPIILTAIHTGMRKSELLNLIWSDIDFNQSIVTIQPKDDWNTKNYEPRTVFLTPVLYEMLQKRYRNWIESGIRCEYVFTYKGARIKNGIDTTLRKVVKEAGLKNVTLHTLRHTFASQLAASGVPLRHIQELMGHQSYQTTLRYAHLSKEHVKKQVLQLPFAEDFASLGHNLSTRLD